MLLILVLAICLTYLILRQYQKGIRLPPGPLCLPLIGNIPQLIYYVWKLKGIVPALNFFRETYGDVFTLWIGPLPHVSICDYETSQEVFVKNGNKYKDRFAPPVFEHIHDNLGLIFSNGEVWAEMRRFTLLTFRNMGVGRDIMEQKILDEITARCSNLDSKCENGSVIVHIREFFDITVGSVINNMLVGKPFDVNNKQEYLELKKLVDNTAEFFTIFDVTAPVWFLKKFFPKRFSKTVTLQHVIMDYVSRDATDRYEKVKSGEYTLNSEDPQDYVEAYLVKKEQENLIGDGSMYTMECLKHVLGDLWQAGQDTTSLTLVSGFNQLVNHPDVIRKCREELLKVTSGGTRMLQLKDRAETPYLNATIAEIQRHASILNVNFWRLNHETTMVKGYTVEPGTFITAQLGALHVNKDMFPSPEKFNPERFLENGKLLKQVIPFGIGKRSCVGENIARAQVYLMIGNLLLRYHIKPYGALPSTADTLPYSSAKQPDFSVRMEFIKLR